MCPCVSSCDDRVIVMRWLRLSLRLTQAESDGPIGIARTALVRASLMKQFPRTQRATTEGHQETCQAGANKYLFYFRTTLSVSINGLYFFATNRKASSKSNVILILLIKGGRHEVLLVANLSIDGLYFLATNVKLVEKLK